MILASVVLPVPGGPQKMSEPMSSRSICVRSGLPGPTRCLLPDKFIERARTHAVGERPRAVDSIIVRRIVLEKAHGTVSPRRTQEITEMPFTKSKDSP